MQTSMGVLGLLFVSAVIVLCCIYNRKAKDNESEEASKSSMSRGHSVIESSLEQCTKGAPIIKGNAEYSSTPNPFTESVNHTR